MGNPLEVGAETMIPLLTPCGSCCHYPSNANMCLTPAYYGRHLGFDKAPHLRGGWAFTADDIWQGIADAISAAREMRCPKGTTVPTPGIID